MRIGIKNDKHMLLFEGSNPTSSKFEGKIYFCQEWGWFDPRFGVIEI